MTDKEYLFKLMHRAFLDIRIASYSKDNGTCFVLSDVFHNVPLKMNVSDDSEQSYAEIVESIQERCEERKCTRWLDVATTDIKNSR